MATSKSMRLAAQAIGRESIKVAAVSAGGKIFRDAGVSGDIKVTDELFSIYREIGSGKSPLMSFGNLTERLAKLRSSAAIWDAIFSAVSGIKEDRRDAI